MLFGEGIRGLGSGFGICGCGALGFRAGGRALRWKFILRTQEPFFSVSAGVEFRA